MNIMLVSVTERTREIGIRKSLGAKTASIMLQFLAEAAILTVIGGLIGILLGVLAAYGICTVMSNSMGMAISPGISPTVVLAATLFSCAVGVFFGIYPARKSRKTEPDRGAETKLNITKILHLSRGEGFFVQKM